jgi:proteasome assembly chaperone (PAC2) family protein
VFRNGAIGGINGLLAGMAPFYGLRGYCLLGTTSGDDLIDLRAISNLLDAIKKVLDLDLPLQVLPATEEYGKPSSFEEMDMNYR